MNAVVHYTPPAVKKTSHTAVHPTASRVHNVFALWVRAGEYPIFHTVFFHVSSRLQLHRLQPDIHRSATQSFCECRTPYHIFHHPFTTLNSSLSTSMISPLRP